MIHLDTSFLIRSLESSSAESLSLRTWLSGGESVEMSMISWSEFLCGPLSPEATELSAKLLSELVPFGTNEAEVASMLYNQSGRKRGSMVDCMIAATALYRGAQLATSDVRHFKHFEPLGLTLIL